MLSQKYFKLYLKKDESRAELNISESTLFKKVNIESNVHLVDSVDTNEEVSDPRRDLIRMHNAIACCTIVAYILLVATWCTSISSAASKKVPPTLATFVLNSLIVVFDALLLAIYHRKIIAEQRQSECFDMKLLFDVTCSSRVVKFGYSLALGWASLIFTVLNAICWFHIGKMQKLLFSNGYY